MLREYPFAGLNTFMQDTYENTMQTAINDFTRKQELAHSATHALGVLFILIGAPLIFYFQELDLVTSIGFGFYSLTFLLVFLASALYHYIEAYSFKKIFKLLDHIGIFMFIIGTNVCFLIKYAYPSGAYFLWAMIGLGLFGIANKIFGWIRSEVFSLLYYLAIGWMGIFTLFIIRQEISLLGISFVFLGAVLYSIGAYYYKHDDKRIWHHTIWHVLVLTAAIIHFLAIVMG